MTNFFSSANNKHIVTHTRDFVLHTYDVDYQGVCVGYMGYEEKESVSQERTSTRRRLDNNTIQDQSIVIVLRVELLQLIVRGFCSVPAPESVGMNN